MSKCKKCCKKKKVHVSYSLSFKKNVHEHQTCGCSKKTSGHSCGKKHGGHVSKQSGHTVKKSCVYSPYHKKSDGHAHQHESSTMHQHKDESSSSSSCHCHKKKKHCRCGCKRRRFCC